MADARTLPALRPYQREAARAILGSVLRGEGRSFSVLFARQGGKNELSAQIELVLLLAYHDRAVEAIKCAPTFVPQGRVSRNRLWARLTALGLTGPRGPAVRDGADAIRLGQARQRFLSAAPGAHVVGHTAHTLLEVDEAQDVDAEKFDREFRPMAAATNATIVFYGTAWDETCLLAQAIARHQEQECADGVRRHFAADWTVVTRYSPAYGAYVAAERERLGEAHPLFQTQYLLRTLPRAGRLFSDAALMLLRGTHPRLDAPPTGDNRAALYVAGLDVGGEALATRGDPDGTVLTIARVLPAPAEALVRDPPIEVVAHAAWQGVGHARLAGAIAALARQWRLVRLAIDATGIGEGLAASLAAAAAGTEVVRVRLSAERKSALGYALQAAAEGGRLRLYADDGSPEWAAAWFQARHARAQLRPNRLLAFDVDPALGHDDYLLSLALAVEAANDLTPRVAVGRRGEIDLW
jgi:hypothetical protein